MCFGLVLKLFGYSDAPSSRSGCVDLGQAMALRDEAMRRNFSDLVKEIGTAGQVRDWDATEKDWRARLRRWCKTIDVLDQPFEEKHMLSVLDFVVRSSQKGALKEQMFQCLKLMMQDSQWSKVAESNQEIQDAIRALVSPQNETDIADEALGEGGQIADFPQEHKPPEAMDDHKTPGTCHRCSRLCGLLCCCCCVALVLLVVALACSGQGVIILADLPIQCGSNPMCYHKVFKEVVVVCSEVPFPPSPQCMKDQFFHSVKRTGFSEENIISVCGLNIFGSCWKDRCPEAWDTSCWLWGPLDPDCGAASVGEDKRPLASMFPKIYLNITGGLHKILASDMKVKLAKHEEATHLLRHLFVMKNPNAPKFHRDAFISEQPQIMDSDKDNTVTQAEYKNYVLDLIQEYPTLFTQRQRIVFMGNPGRGKSTLLNALAGTVLFEAGQAKDGAGVTRKMSVIDIPHRVPGYGFWTLVDTPGLADESQRKVAAAEIKKALRSDENDAGDLIPHRMIFVITLNGGRVSEEDKITMKVILRAAREITSAGIIVNQWPADRKMDRESQKQIEARLLFGINDKVSTYLHWFPEISEARFADNFIIAAEPVEKLWAWIKSIPPVHVRDVDALELADMKDLLAQVQAEMKALRESREEEKKTLAKMEEDLRKADEKQAQDAKKMEELRQHIALLRRAEKERQQKQKATDESAWAKLR